MSVAPVKRYTACECGTARDGMLSSDLALVAGWSTVQAFWGF